MLIQAANLGTVEWPKNVTDAFKTLQNLQESLAQEVETESILVPTASNDDVLVFAGVFVSWHNEHDHSFTTAEDFPRQWFKNRPQCAVDFDYHWCEAAVGSGPGFLGDLLRTAEYLENEALLIVLAMFVETELNRSKKDNNETIDCFCKALVG